MHTTRLRRWLPNKLAIGVAIGLGLSGLSHATMLNNDSALFQNNANKVVGTYFVEWGVYGRNFHVNDIPAKNLTHVLYGFIAVCGPNESLQKENPQGYSALTRECTDQPDYTV
ncbi:hypothetical protein KCG35_08515, partial [Zooshikella sp. WH53]|nr:hypothetical protein [Zooshikella harenae]